MHVIHCDTPGCDVTTTAHWEESGEYETYTSGHFTDDEGWTCLDGYPDIIGGRDFCPSHAPGDWKRQHGPWYEQSMIIGYAFTLVDK